MKPSRSSKLILFLAGALLLPEPQSSQAAVRGWLHFRGPQQNGTSLETQLPTQLKVDGPSQLWTADLSGQSSPVIAGDKLYVMGYVGEGPDLQELLACYNADTGEKLWDHRWNDFLSDIIYTRYSTSAPTIDPETGNVFVQGTQGVIAGFTPDGKKLWQHSMMELYGRLTFPNGRTASPKIEGDLVITHHITANWGANGPGRDRFYAFDKTSGELVWFSTPGGPPKDSSFSPPYLHWWNGQRVVYCGTGDGSIVCFNALTGNPIWYVKISQGGVNAAVLVHDNDKLIAIHGSENIDNSEIGRMVAVKIPQSVPAGASPHQFAMKDLELWRNPDLSAFTTSPILVGDVIYSVTETGDLVAVDAATGKVKLPRLKLGIEQRNASLLHADGHLWIPMLEDPQSKEAGADAGTRGAFYVVKPGADKFEIVSHLSLEGRCFGSPAIWNGKIYVQTTRKLYCFGKKGQNPGLPPEVAPVKYPKPGKAVALQIIPPEVLLEPGEAQSFEIRKVDANGMLVEKIADVSQVKWESYIPPTAKVKARMNAAVNAKGQLVATKEEIPSAGAFKATIEGLSGVIRGRVLPGLPLRNDFESFEISETHPEGHPEAGTAFSYPPLPWIGARFKFEIREVDGSKALTKTIDNKFFQRGIVFMGQPNMSNYTVEADLMTDGTRRKLSEMGVINQHYYILLKGNAQKLQVNSNLERIKEEVSFSIRPKTWYHLKTRVDVAEDGSGVVRAKAWPRDEAEPEAWTIEVPHAHAHTEGSPGLFGFAPQEMKCYIDNILVTPNK